MREKRAFPFPVPVIPLGILCVRSLYHVYICGHMMESKKIVLFRSIGKTLFLKKLDRAYSSLKQQCQLTSVILNVYK